MRASMQFMEGCLDQALESDHPDNVGPSCPHLNLLSLITDVGHKECRALQRRRHLDLPAVCIRVPRTNGAGAIALVLYCTGRSGASAQEGHGSLVHSPDIPADEDADACQAVVERVLVGPLTLGQPHLQDMAHPPPNVATAHQNSVIGTMLSSKSTAEVLNNRSSSQVM